MFIEKKRTTLFIIATLALFFSLNLISCGTDSEPDEPDFFEDGIHEEVLGIIGDELLDVIENELEMPIHRGSEPPNLNSVAVKTMATDEVITFLISPMLLLNTTVPNDEGRFETGRQFADTYFLLSNQNTEDYTIDFQTISTAADEPIVGEGSYIIGEEDRFTVFGPLERVTEDGTTLSMNMFSEVLIDEGVEEPYYSFLYL